MTLGDAPRPSADGETLPGTGDPAGDDADRVVCHVDMDCFYASCERLRRPELNGEPVVVGMGYEPGESAGAVATASYEARAVGVESAMPISEALELLPRQEDAAPDDRDAGETGRYVPVDMAFYEDVAGEVKSVLRDCAETLREVSVDEAYLDATDRTAWTVAGDDPDDPPASAAAGPATARTLAEGYARHVKRRIEREAGVPASVGVAPNMSTAKVASDVDKPDGLVVVPPGTVAEFLAPLPTAAVHGVGPVTERTLAEMGIETAGELAAADRDRLAEALGERGPELSRRAAGDDDRAVTPTGRPKSLSRESALPTTADRGAKQETVSTLAADVAHRARERGCLYRTIGIKAVEPPFDVNTRARSLPGPVDDPDLVAEVALDLLGEFDETRVRKLGVRVSNLEFAEADQATLGGFDAADRGGDRDGRGDDRDDNDGRGDDRDDNDGRGGRGDLAGGGKLTDWVGGPPERGDGEAASEGGDRRRTDDGQASLGDWS